MPSGYERTDVTDEEVWRAYTATETATLADAGAAFGMSRDWAKVRALRYRKAHGLPAKRYGGPTKAQAAAGGRKRGDWATLDNDGPRCKCGLRLPCERCVPTAVELAGSRTSPVIEEAPEEDAA